MIFKKCCPFYGGGSAIVYSLLVVDVDVCGCLVLGLCSVLLYIVSFLVL